ncbi:PEP-utilizing enzyme [Streptomyces sp. NPDC050617]|uniref:PEP-utilizing enzyme n=1 Tax=Streptomyces sp. NPDC050617 TaxID=3154628 RepID=UPI0034293F82
MTATQVRFGTKAETLKALDPLLASGKVLPAVHFTVRDWSEDRAGVLGRILRSPWAAAPLAVRSSARGEDSLLASQAGRFHTSLGVVGRVTLERAVETVIASYDGPDGDHQVLVQPQLTNVVASGVACSCDPSSGAPYRVLTWLDGGETDAVTSGRGDGVRTWYGAVEAVRAGIARPPVAGLEGVLALVDEVVTLTGHDRVEVEFAVTTDGDAVLLQARPLVVQPSEVGARAHSALLGAVADRWAHSAADAGKVLGSRPLYGVMPDWNPAEIIGVRPRPLALSLYRRLITDRTWARSRAAYGYRDLTGVPLLAEFAGIPYVDIRASFSSFVPAALPDRLAGRLVDHYTARLADNLHLHDKVEFTIVLSCNSFDLRRRLAELADHGFQAADRALVRQSLVTLTNRLLAPDGAWRRDVRRLELLPTARDGIRAALTACVEYGALPFAGLARAGFVGVQLLDGLVAAGVLSQPDRAAVLGGLRTVASAITEDFATLDRAVFLERYGHLRPGTYDILSPRYDEAPDLYFDWARGASPPAGAEAFRPSAAQRRDITELLREAGFTCTADELLHFIGESVKERERAKFEFTRVLSDVLVTARRTGHSHGFTDEDISYMEIDTLTALRGDASDRAALERAVERGRGRHAGTRSVLLPPLLLSPEDAWGFELPDMVPNFVTQLRVQAPVADIERGAAPEGAIAFVASADPGYDWLFARGIRALVTAYGGMNSHMAIRAQELGIPAVMGVGERKFALWRRAEVLDLDCANRMVEVLS